MLTKVNRSLGFTLRKEDESVLGHYVRALVREPALSDGRIRPGDKIVAVSIVDMTLHFLIMGKPLVSIFRLWCIGTLIAKQQAHDSNFLVSFTQSVP
jgi:hypothetical protein